MARNFNLGVVVLVFLMFLTSSAFGQLQQPPVTPRVSQPQPQPLPSSPAVTQPQQQRPGTASKTPPKVLPPHLVRFKINNGASTATNPTVTLDFVSIPLGANVRQEDIEASKPTHYRWNTYGGFPLKCDNYNSKRASDWLPVRQGITPFATLPTTCELEYRGPNGPAGVLKKGICGEVHIRLEVKNSAGVSQMRDDKIEFVGHQSEFLVDEDVLLKAYSAKVTGTPGSVCKVHKDIKRYVQGGEALSAPDEIWLMTKFTAGWMNTPHFFAMGATPVTGSKCDYELYPVTLPQGWSVVSFKSYCSGLIPVGTVGRDSNGCIMMRNPQGTRDLTTKFRIWTDPLKSNPGVWAYLQQGDVILKGDCRGLSGLPMR